MISTDIHKSSLQVGSDIWYSQPLSLAKPLRSATERNHRGHHSSTSQFFRSCEWNAELQDLAICQQDKGEPSPFFFKISLKNPKHLKSHITTWPKLKFPTALLRANRASLGEEKSSGVFFFFLMEFFIWNLSSPVVPTEKEVAPVLSCTLQRNTDITNLPTEKIQMDDAPFLRAFQSSAVCKKLCWKLWIDRAANTATDENLLGPPSYYNFVVSS